MSRKNLSRTVIEGGRYRYNKFQRRSSHGIERATTRAWLDQVTADTEHADYTAPPPLRPVRRSFYDKLAPAKRWLASNVGRPWDKVYQELCTTFSRKTIAGNHVVEHMLDWVQIGPHARHRNVQFVVDPHGILRCGPLYGWSYSRLRKEALAWAENRRVARTRSGLWWFHVRGVGTACTTYKCSAKHLYLPDGYRYHELASTSIRPLTGHELRRFALIPIEIRSQLMI